MTANYIWQADLVEFSNDSVNSASSLCELRVPYVDSYFSSTAILSAG